MRYLAAGLLLLWAQDKPAYLWYSAKGKPLSYAAVLAQLKKADVVLFGELHNNPIAHWMELELFIDLHRTKGDSLLLGMEMLEADQQEALLKYLRGEIATIEKLSEAIALWPNFHTDYAPLLAYARKNKLPVYATNAPRQIARAVSREGIEALNGLGPEQRRFVAPLPFARLDTLPSYQRMTEMASGHGIDPEPFRLAQMLKDATMAHFIAQSYRPGTPFFHLNGRYHSDFHEGIAAYLRLYNPSLRVVVISTEEVEDPKAYRPPKPAPGDLILVVPERMTKTH